MEIVASVLIFCLKAFSLTYTLFVAIALTLAAFGVGKIKNPHQL